MLLFSEKKGTVMHNAMVFCREKAAEIVPPCSVGRGKSEAPLSHPFMEDEHPTGQHSAFNFTVLPISVNMVDFCCYFSYNFCFIVFYSLFLRFVSLDIVINWMQL